MALLVMLHCSSSGEMHGKFCRSDERTVIHFHYLLALRNHKLLQMPFVRGVNLPIAALVAMQFIGRTLAEAIPVTNEDQFLSALLDGSDIQIEASFSVSRPASVGMSSVPGSSIISILVCPKVVCAQVLAFLHVCCS